MKYICSSFFFILQQHFSLFSFSIYISANKMSRELELALPPSAVEGSAKAKVTIIGKFVA